MTKIPTYRAVLPEGHHLASSSKTPGALLGAYLSDDTNQLAGQAEFIPIDDEVEDTELEELEDDPSSLWFFGLGIVGGVVAAVVAPKIKRWLIDDAVPSVKYRLKRKVKTDESEIPTVLAAVTPADMRHEIEAAISDPGTVMSDDEARRRFIMMLLAVAFAAEQFRALSNCQVADESAHQELRAAIEGLSNRSVADLANRIITSDDSAIDKESRAALSRLFGATNETNFLLSAETISNAL